MGRKAGRKAVLLVAVVGVALLSAGGIALAATVECGDGFCAGTEGDDRITGTDGADAVKGKSGDDTIDGRGDGGRFADTLRGGDDDDTIYADGGPNPREGKGNRDNLIGRRGNDVLHGGQDKGEYDPDEGPVDYINNDDLLSGERGDDTVYGRGGRDYATGGPGSDEVYGGPGRDVMLGDEGDDVLRAADGEADVVYCDEPYTGPAEGAEPGTNDVVYADAADDVRPGSSFVPSSGCEAVFREP